MSYTCSKESGILLSYIQSKNDELLWTAYRAALYGLRPDADLYREPLGDLKSWTVYRGTERDRKSTVFNI